MNKAIIKYYTKLIRDGIKTIDDVKDEYRSAVEDSLKGISQNVITNNTTINTRIDANNIVNSINGAPYLGSIPIKINSICKTSNECVIKSNIQISSLFNNTSINSEKKEFPENINFKLIRIENIYGKFLYEPKVEITIDEYLNIYISGKMTDEIIKPDDTIIRLDFNITSSNYEDMHCTIYIVMK